MSITIKSVTGAALARHIDALARLRIDVFRDFPYLYDGDMDYERRYLQTYTQAPGSVVVLALDGDKAVGASTAVPMRNETAECRQPFLDHGYDVNTVFYCGESVLQKSYRGRGIGVEFFRQRERHARALGGFIWSCFCAVERPDDHPRRPAGYVPLDAFWRNRGYARHPALRTSYTWRDLGEAQQTAKPMVFWLKRLTAG